MNKYFETTDYTNFIPTKQQQDSLKKNFEFVKGCDYYKGYYDKKIINKILIRYYQLAIFNEKNKKCIKSYLFSGESSKGACFYDYKILEIKDYSINIDDFSKFLKILENRSKNNNLEIKIMFKFYPVYNFEFTSPPSGNEISQCYSELLN